MALGNPATARCATRVAIGNASTPCGKPRSASRAGGGRTTRSVPTAPSVTAPPPRKRWRSNLPTPPTGQTGGSRHSLNDCYNDRGQVSCTNTLPSMMPATSSWECSGRSIDSCHVQTSASRHCDADAVGSPIPHLPIAVTGCHHHEPDHGGTRRLGALLGDGGRRQAARQERPLDVRHQCVHREFCLRPPLGVASAAQAHGAIATGVPSASLPISASSNARPAAPIGALSDLIPPRTHRRRRPRRYQ